MSELVSIIIPTYRRPDDLRRVLAALGRQSRPPRQIIVVNDGPAYQDFHIDLPHFELIWIDHGQGGGPAAARNIGARRASSPWIGFLDDDTEPDAQWLEKLWDVTGGERMRVCGGRVEAAPGAGTTSQVFEFYTNSILAHCTENDEPIPFLPSNNLILNRELFLSLGGFDEGMRTSEDVELSRRLVAAGATLEWNPAAWVYHHRPLSVAQFLRVRFRYGTGVGATARKLGRAKTASRMAPGFFLRRVLSVPAGQSRLLAMGLFACGGLAYNTGAATSLARLWASNALGKRDPGA